MKRKRINNEKDTPKSKRVKLEKNGLWITKLPDHTTVLELSKYIEELGKIKEIILFKNNDKDVSCNVLAAIMFDGKIADDAIEYNGSNILDSKINLRFINKDDFTIDLYGVDIEIENLKKIVEEVGDVEEIKKVEEKHYAIEYKNISSVKEILQYNGADINGKMIKIKYKNLEK